MENSLYQDLARVYEGIANDRDFASECDFVLDVWRGLQKSSPRTNWNSLELFAGPAYHSQIFSKKTQGSTYCVDNSHRMQEIAEKQYGIPKSQYWVKEIPHSLDQIPNNIIFDLVIALRYSCGLISPLEIETMLANLSNKLNPNSLLVFELHRPQNLIASFSDFGIHKRTASIGSEKWSCTWPSSRIEWDENLPKVKMKIELSNDLVNHLQTESHEWFHTIYTFEIACKHTPGFEVLPSSYGSFSINRQSKFVLIRKI